MIDAVVLVNNEVPFVNGHIALAKQGDDALGSGHLSICLLALSCLNCLT